MRAPTPRRIPSFGCEDGSIAGHAGLDPLGPCVDAAGDIAHGGESLGAKKLRHAQAAGTGVTEDEQVFVARQVVHLRRDLAHRDELGAGHAADGCFMGLAHVDEQGSAGRVVKQAPGFGDGDFERIVGGVHAGGWSSERESERAAPQMKLRPRRPAAGIGGMRYIGIDLGTRRIGLAFGDELGVGTPLPALTQADAAERRAALLAIIRERRADAIVLGHPLNMDDTAGPKAKEAEAFAAQLRAELGLPVHLVDERLTSYEAESSIAKAKRRSVRASGIIDSRAATLILQDYLNQVFPPVEEEPS